jgi:hypothetical protein
MLLKPFTLNQITTNYTLTNYHEKESIFSRYFLCAAIFIDTGTNTDRKRENPSGCFIIFKFWQHRIKPDVAGFFNK